MKFNLFSQKKCDEKSRILCNSLERTFKLFPVIIENGNSDVKLVNYNMIYRFV